ncbi:MAG TPA: NADPH:quinone oxidoreductase family protein, partial [Paracoccaceae bacterium]|nr:NADPH:quinone oxidoreductase family protein [Paracoccaceae bacterium]
DIAGVVTAVGPGVSGFSNGDKVMGMISWGGFAEEAVCDAGRLAPLPEGVDLDVAAAFPMVYGTSYHALMDRGELKAGETVLVLGAAGGVGLAAVEIAKAAGAKVIAAASTEDKLAVCKAHGADQLLNYSEGDLRKRLKEICPEGPDVIYDPVGGDLAEPAFRSIGWRGRHLVVGFAGGEIPKIPLNLCLLKNAALVGVFWGAYLAKEPQSFRKDMQTLVGWLREGKIKPLISERYSLGEAPQAIRALADRKATGKIIVEPQR